MAALTDLTWQQLQAELPTGTITVVSGKVVIDTSLVTANTIDALTDTGVVKFFSMLFSAANKAQTEANLTQVVVGEKLAAFKPATIGTGVAGYIPLTRTFVCRSELATATVILGTNE